MKGTSRTFTPQHISSANVAKELARALAIIDTTRRRMRLSGIHLDVRKDCQKAMNELVRATHDLLDDVKEA